MERKQRRLLMVLAMTVAIGVAASAANAQMVAGWLFEEGAGTVAKDHIGYGIDLVLFGDTAWDSDVPPDLVGISTRSIVLDGSGDYGEVQSGAMEYITPTGGPWTIMLWERINSYVNNSSPMDMGGSFRIGIYDNEIEVGVSTGGSWDYATGGSINDTNWHHLCGTYDGATVRSYVDGVGTGSFSLSSYDTDSSTLRIGRGVDWGSQYNGKIDEAAIFQEVLDLATIRSLMKNGIGSFVNSNLAPFIDAGPAYGIAITPWPLTVPPYTQYNAEYELDGYAVDNTNWPDDDPHILTARWELVSAPPGGGVTFDPAATDLQSTAIFTKGIYGLYTLQLYATDGEFTVTSPIEVDVKHYTYTGLQNHWAFDNNLDDTAPLKNPYSTKNDYLVQKGSLPAFYGPGIVGDAIHVGHTDFGGGWSWLETPLPHVNISQDLHLNRAFTVELYVNPQLDKATTESDQLEWQDLIQRWFTYTPGQETYFQSYEFIVNYGNIGLNKTDPTDFINLPRDTDWRESAIGLGAHSFPRTLGWQHIAFVGDGNGNVTFYIDGEKQGTGAYPTPEFFVTTTTPLRIANTLVNANGGVGRASPYVGWIDDLHFFEYNKPASYVRDRARLIPLQSPFPLDGYQYAYPGVVLAWAKAKGFSGEVPTYDVYFAQDGQPLTLAATGLTDTSFDPVEAGPVPDLNLDTTYNWQVIAQTSVGPISSAEWSFKTIAADFLGLDGTALIGHWKLDEGTGTDAHDSAGDDDVGSYRYPTVGVKDPPQWIPGWIAANPAFGLRFRQFEYITIEAVDINQYIDLIDGSYTLATWMKTTPMFVNNDPDFIGFGLSYAIGRNETDQVVESYHGGIAGNTTAGVTPVGDGYWHHVAAVYEAPTPVKDTLVYIYVDGKLDATERVNGNHFRDGTAELRLGTNTSESTNFTGALDDVRIYRRALGAAEIKELFDLGIVNSPPVVHAGTNVIVPFPGLTWDLDTVMRDDSAPLQTNPRMSWMQTGGTGTVTFDPCIIEAGNMVGFVKDVDNILTTTLTFSEPGFYNIRLKADDTIYDHADSVRIWVQKAVEEFPTTVAYWRYEEDTPETDYRGGGDDPNTLVIANEVASGSPLIAERSWPDQLPDLHPTVMHSVIPLTGAANVGHAGEGPGLTNYFGRRLGTSGMSIQMEAETWDGLVFCEDGITVECYIKLDEQNWTVFDMLDAGKGLRFFNSSGDPSNRLRFQFYVETDVPNQFDYINVISDILVYEMGWMHVAFTYDKTTGVARVYHNGVPAWITHVDPGPGGFVENTPWLDHWQGEPGRTFVLAEDLNLFVSTGVDTIPSGFDELRITAEPLWAQRLLVKGPAECAEKIQGDLDGDCDVDVFDLQIFCDSWLLCNNADPTECFK